MKNLIIMLINRFQNYYRIESARAQWHDYAGGSYFITICTENRECFFGEIMEMDGCNQLFLSEIGEYASITIEDAPKHYLYAAIPTYVVMPNHIHLIAVVGMPASVETVHAPSLQGQNRWKNDIVDERMQKIARRKNKLSYLVGSIKSNITHIANQNGIRFGWQPRFHDHIIRNLDEMNRIANYIENNVANWKTNRFYR